MADISTTELREYLDTSKEFTLIDVREIHEHEEFNSGGSNLPICEINTWLPELTNDKDDEIVLYCRSGNRSTMGVAFMTSYGYTNVRSLDGGMVAWQEGDQSQ